MDPKPPLIASLETPEIRNREDFVRILTSTTIAVDSLVAREPAYPVWGVLQRQLHAMQEWTANGSDPEPAQRDRISIGLIAARELEPAADAGMQDLITKLHLLNYYWRRWPSERVPSRVPPPLQETTERLRLTIPPFKMTPLVVISLLLFAAACCLPALEFRNSGKPNDIMYGLRALAVGWSGIFAGVYAWYANPFWLAGIVLSLLRRPTAAALVGVVALAIAATSFAIVGKELPADEGNVTRTTVIRLLPGCYAWMSSIALLMHAGFLRHRN